MNTKVSKISAWKKAVIRLAKGLFEAVLGLLLLSIVTSQAAAQGIVPLWSDSGDYSSYANDHDSVWVNYVVDWYYEGYSFDPPYNDYVVIVVNGSDYIATVGISGFPVYGKALVPVSERTSNMLVEVYWQIADSGYWLANSGGSVSATHYSTRAAVSRSSISLGQVRVGRHKADTMTVYSTGTTPVAISSALNSGAQFSRYPTSSNRTISAGAREIDSAIFSPATRGMFSDSLIFTTNSTEAAERRMAVYVTGQGIQAIFSPTNGTALAFGNLHADRTAQQTFSFSNSGDDTLFLQSPSIAGSAFTIVSGPSSLTVPPNQSRNVVVQFAPTARQSYSGTLSFTASNGVSVPSVALSGNGILPQIQISNVLSFGQLRVGRTSQATLTYTNIGNDTLHISSPVLAPLPARFTLNSYDQTVLPGATGMLRLTYAPTVRNIDVVQLRVATDDPARLFDTISVSGQGIQAYFVADNGTTLDFGSVRLGSTVQKTFTFLNLGEDTLFLQSPTFEGNGFSTVSGPMNLTVLPNATRSVVVQFAPTAEQPYSGSIVFSALNGVSAPTVMLMGNGALPHMVVARNRQTVDLGQVKVNSNTSLAFTVANTGGIDLQLGNVTAKPLPFSVITTPSSVGGYLTENVVVSFAPTATGPFSGILVIAGNDAMNPSDTIFLAGTGINSALTINPVNVDFGAVQVFHIVVDTIKLSNAGTASVKINSYKLTSTTGVFAVVDSSAKQVSAGGTAYVLVSFRPDATGSFSGTLTLSTDDAGAPIRTINLSGLGAKGKLVAMPSSVDFGNVSIGHDSTIRSILKNNGQVTATISSVAMVGSAFSHGTFGSPQTIKAGDSAFIALTFRPSAFGMVTGSVSMTLDDNSVVTVGLTGVGISTAGVSDGRMHAAKFALTFSPNPASSFATAHITLPQASDGALEIFDATGHEALRIPLGLLSQGTHDVPVPIEGLRSGSYFVRVTNANGDAAGARFILLK